MAVPKPKTAAAAVELQQDGVPALGVNRGRYEVRYQVSTRSLVIRAARASVSRARVWYSAWS